MKWWVQKVLIYEASEEFLTPLEADESIPGKN